MGNHTHSTPAHSHPLDTGSSSGTGTATTSQHLVSGTGNILNTISLIGGTTTPGMIKDSTTTSGAGTSGVPSTNTSDASTATNNANTTGVTASLGTGIATLPPYLGMYKMIRVI